AGSTTRAAAPRATASETNWWPSNRSPTRATNNSPGRKVRVSVLTPATGTVPSPRTREPGMKEAMRLTGAKTVMLQAPPYGRSRFFPIVEMHSAVPENLFRLVPFARHEDEIPRLSPHNGLRDGLPAVDDDGHIALGLPFRPGPVRPRGHFRANGFRIFAAGIVRRDDDSIRQPGRDAPHQGALRPVPVTAAPKHDPQFVVGKLAGSPQHVFQTVGGVGVVHQHRKRLAS